MSEYFQGVTFANQNVTPVDDAILRRRLLSDGILTGCELTYAGYTLTMAAGYLIACGRQIRRPTAENWAISDATSGYARVLMTVDLTRTATEEVFDQVNTAIQYATSADGFPALIQDDINTTGSEYQLVLAVVSLGTGGITGITSSLAASTVSAPGFAYNLLDNSDFEIAQAGYGGKHGSKVYAADRWMQNDTTERTYTYTTKNGHGALKCSTDTRIQQKLHLVDGQDYTAAFYINNTLHILNFTANGAENGSGSIWVNKQSDGTYMFIVSNIPAGVIVYEPVLYIGSYTAETLPPYVPKGYAAELAECQRYCYIVSEASNVAFPGMLFDAKTVRMSIRLPVKMRVNPTVTVENISKLDTYTTGGAVIPTAYTAVTAGNNQFIVLNLTVPSGKTVSTPTVTRVNTIIEISADL